MSPFLPFELLLKEDAQHLEKSVHELNIWQVTEQPSWQSKRNKSYCSHQALTPSLVPAIRFILSEMSWHYNV